jgi:hypothetical protein
VGAQAYTGASVWGLGLLEFQMPPVTWMHSRGRDSGQVSCSCLKSAG